ncbi:nuclear transport factor 2 family protein [Bradyrhizobium elkanii]|uniref:nuclear transport factor 2 family protein n=1 Tax=Bradyrhizobium elkanii TaxID=29448 RepID=UPI001FD95373|nr:nuclear transport factor 2 family protein [Bradyrhizobium elkanii]MBP2434040.1 hypothetical protein [Bradyrhizobium elkanii]WLA89023.1 nuclear transport factor 2 family protein [Bradyrhizobium elkanii]
MAAAVDWLDVYRAGDLEAIIGMYADDAVIYCDCGSTKTPAGREALRAYWVDRLKLCPALELEDIRQLGGETAISCFTSERVVNADLTFNATGQSRRLAVVLPTEVALLIQFSQHAAPVLEMQPLDVVEVSKQPSGLRRVVAISIKLGN